MISKKFPLNFLINSFIVILIFLLDRFSKIYVIYLDKKFFGSEIFSSKFLNIHLIWNEGIAFGLFSFDQNNLYNILSAVIFLVILIIFIWFIRSKGLKKYSLIVIFSGALGNFCDRIFYGAVPDFIDFHVGNFHWFIFNVSDIFITIGVIGMIFLELTDKKYTNAV
jgi:signal peptidase II